MAFVFYLLYVTSYFLHFGERIPALGSIRIDLILVILTAVCIVLLNDKDRSTKIDKTGIILLGILLYIVITLPLVQWPGSVINSGFENYFKVIIFYFFTVLIVTNQQKLKIFLFVFAACQMYRVLEPLYLHVTMDYWGDATFMGHGEMMDRLAGSPYDVINPNGLAFVAVTSIVFIFYLSRTLPSIWRVTGHALLPLMVYALVLTGSRSGMVALAGVAVGIIMTSRRKIIFISVLILLSIFAFQRLDDMQQDRYLSIYRGDVRGASTAQGRIEGIYRDFEVAMNRPLFGHGLGTSLEASYNIGSTALRSHNLVMEVWQEIGLVGLIIYFYYIIISIRNYLTALRRMNQPGIDELRYMARGVGAWLILLLIFSIFSYGLSSYSWYLFGGLSVVFMRLLTDNAESERNGVAPA